MKFIWLIVLCLACLASMFSMYYYTSQYRCQILLKFNGTAHFKHCKQLFEYQHLLLLRHIGWSKLCSILKCCSFISTPMLIRHLWQLKTVVFLHWCLTPAVLLHLLYIFSIVELSCKYNLSFDNFANVRSTCSSPPLFYHRPLDVTNPSLLA